MSFLSDLWLKSTGHRIQALVTSVTTATSTSEMFHSTKGLYAGNVNVATNVYIVTATWIDPRSGTSYSFEKRCFSDNRPLVSEGQPVNVYTNPRHPRRYLMDIPCQ